MSNLSPYEEGALREIDLFKNPPRSKLAALLDRVSAPMDKAGDIVFSTAPAKAVAKAIEGLATMLNDGASWTVRQDAIYEEYRAAGYVLIRRGNDVHDLDLHDADKVVGYLAAKYRAMAFAEGAGTGVLGGAGIALDIPALVGLALRAVNEYATYYGFDIGLEPERAFAMHILGAGSATSVATKQVTMAELTKLSVMLAQKKTWAELQRLLSVQVVMRIAKALGIRLTKTKLAQVVPLIGAGVGAGFNVWYLSAVMETAHYIYRERFLITKYGSAVAVAVRGSGAAL